MGDVIEKSGGIHLRDADPEALPSQPLLCSPPAFTVESATDYGFKQYKASDHGIDSLGRKPKRSNNGLVGAKALIDYLTPEVPAAQTYPPPGAPLDIQTLAQRLSDLLQQRPVYLDGALEHALAAVSSTPTALGGGGVNSSDVAYNSPNTGQQQEILAKLCYRFRNGPWKGAWIRRGYDPRQHPDARQYQVLTYTLPADWYRKLAKHRQECAASSSARPHASLRDATTLPPLAQGYGALCQFCGVPSTSATQMQLCDIEDSQISTILADSNNICEASNDGSGWFRQATWEAVKARVAARFQSLLDAAEAALEASAAAADVGGGGVEAGMNAETEAMAVDGDGNETVVNVIPPALMAQLIQILDPGKSTIGAPPSQTAAETAAHAAAAVEGGTHHGEDDLDEDLDESDNCGGGQSGGDEEDIDEDDSG